MHPPQLSVVTRTQGEPVTVGDVKLFAGLFDSGLDGLVGGVIATVRSVLEGEQNRAYNTQTLELALSCFPVCRRPIRLRRAPLQTVTSITLNLADGTTKTVDPTTYVVDARSTPGRILPAVNQDWPTDELAPANGVVIRYVAGYSDYKTATVTIPAATPAVVTWTAHGRTDGDPVSFTGTALPTGLKSDLSYFVASSTTDTFQLALVPNGPRVAVTGSSSGITGRSPGAVPFSICHAIKELAAYYIAHREPYEELQNLQQLPRSFDYLVAQERVWEFA